VNSRLFRGLVSLSLILTAPQVAPEPEEKFKPRVEGLMARVEDDRVLVSYRLSPGLSADMEERIQSGIVLTLSHKVEVVVKRTFPIWWAKDVARTLVDTSVQYDSLTRRYVLVRTIEHKLRPKKDGPLIEEQRRVTDSIDEMRAWMTQLEEIPVFNPGKELQGDRLRVRVEVSLGRRYLMFIFPTTQSVTDEVPLEL
jgi:hypothetical protein